MKDELARVELRRENGVCIAEIEGEIDISNADSIHQVLSNAVSNDSYGLILNLTNTTYIDSAAVRVLFDLARRLQNHNQRLHAVLPERALIGRVLSLTQLDGVMRLHEDLDQASDAIKKDFQV